MDFRIQPITFDDPYTDPDVPERCIKVPESSKLPEPTYSRTDKFKNIKWDRATHVDTPPSKNISLICHHLPRWMNTWAMATAEKTENAADEYKDFGERLLVDDEFKKMTAPSKMHFDKENKTWTHDKKPEGARPFDTWEFQITGYQTNALLEIANTSEKEEELRNALWIILKCFVEGNLAMSKADATCKIGNIHYEIVIEYDPRQRYEWFLDSGVDDAHIGPLPIYASGYGEEDPDEDPALKITQPPPGYFDTFQ
jgi:hypothetical protein